MRNLTLEEIHEKAVAARSIMELDVQQRFMTFYERGRSDKVLQVLKEIAEGTE